MRVTNGYENKQLLAGMTGSAFLAFVRDMLVHQHKVGGELSDLRQAQVNLALDVYGPEYVYMDGELFA